MKIRPSVFLDSQGIPLIKKDKIAIDYNDCTIVLIREKRGKPLRRIAPWIGELCREDYLLVMRFAGAQLDAFDPKPKVSVERSGITQLSMF